MHASWTWAVPPCSRTSWKYILGFFRLIYRVLLYTFTDSSEYSTSLLFPTCFSCTFLSQRSSSSAWECDAVPSVCLASRLACVTSSFVGRSPPTLSCEMKTSQCDGKKTFPHLYSSATVVNPDLLKSHASFWFSSLKVDLLPFFFFSFLTQFL